MKFLFMPAREEIVDNETWWDNLTQRIFRHHDISDAPNRYLVLRRNMIILMLLVTLIPLTFMAYINHYQFQQSLKAEIVAPLRVLVSKAKHSFEMILEERLALIRLISSAYTYEELSDAQTLNRIFHVFQKEFGGFVDLGLIDANGTMVTYAGPYKEKLLGKDYSGQTWFLEVMTRSSYISEVFMGYRNSPHIAIVVHSLEKDGDRWMLRATMETDIFDNLITSMRLDQQSDAFLINKQGILQTNSRYYGSVLAESPFTIPPGNYDTYVDEETDPQSRKVLTAYATFSNRDYALVVVKPQSVVLKSWFSLKSEMFFIFFVSVLIIILIVFKLSEVLVHNIKVADDRREAAFNEMKHNQKLSSIGRLAAGVAHEINNPLAIINEKAGLMKDLVGFSADFPKKEKFMNLTEAILKSVERCRKITHRLLGFARRIEVMFEELNVNDIIKEVLGFVEKEAAYRAIDIRLQLDENMPAIVSDRGQLQQVFLNIITNSIAAVEEGGYISLTSWEDNPNTIAVTIQDNGCGMSEETLSHIFEPFFTTKKEGGTGLGLPITYGIIKKLGGDFKVQSKVGQGTTFTVYIPKKPKEGQMETPI